MSGLKMNDNKTKGIWIGSKKNSQEQFLREMIFCWDRGIFKVLGIKFSTYTDQIKDNTLNWEKNNSYQNISTVKNDTLVD